MGQSLNSPLTLSVAGRKSVSVTTAADPKPTGAVSPDLQSRGTVMPRACGQFKRGPNHTRTRVAGFHDARIARPQRWLSQTTPESRTRGRGWPKRRKNRAPTAVAGQKDARIPRPRPWPSFLRLDLPAHGRGRLKRASKGAATRVAGVFGRKQGRK